MKCYRHYTRRPQKCICITCALDNRHSYYQISTAMSPTIETQDCAISTKIDPKADTITAGDIVVFKHPLNDEVFIFRVMAIAGQSIELRSGVPWIDGVPVKQIRQTDFLRKFVEDPITGRIPKCPKPTLLGGTCAIKQFKEILPNGRNYNILDITRTRLDTISEVVVPLGHVFVMGDNRDNSLDSRVGQEFGGLGFIPIKNIAGRFDDLMPIIE